MKSGHDPLGLLVFVYTLLYVSHLPAAITVLGEMRPPGTLPPQQPLGYFLVKEVTGPSCFYIRLIYVCYTLQPLPGEMESLVPSLERLTDREWDVSSKMDSVLLSIQKVIDQVERGGA